jgi:hypothetical protein
MALAQHSRAKAFLLPEQFCCILAKIKKKVFSLSASILSALTLLPKDVISLD